MEIIDDTTVVVESLSDFRTAVETVNDYNYVYLGVDIQIPFLGITIHPGKTSLVIDGYRNDTIHTITDYNSTSALDTLSVRTASNIELTFKNMIITGRNYYGVPCIFESMDTSGVTVIYDHVAYTGPQITFNPDGLTRYIDCDITIAYPTTPSRAQEVGEVNRVEFDGTNIISHNSTGDAVFWFRGTVGTAYLKVLEGADVTISTTNYFMYSRTPLIPTTNNPVAYEIQADANLTITSNHGISYEPNHWASSFLVDAGASFRYIQETDNENVDTLYLSGGLTVNEGASFYMQADFDGARPLINFIEGNDQISINNPKSFVLYNKASSVVTVGGGNITRPFLITGGQLNQWNVASEFPGAGDVDDGPYRKWNRPSWNSFSMEGSLSLLSTTVNSTTFTPEELADLPDPDDLSFQDARVVSIGNLPIYPDLLADDGRPIGGRTEPYAGVYIDYTVGADDFSFEAMTGPSGTFLFFPQTAIPAGTIITIKSNTPFLITVIKPTVMAVADEIVITRSPDRIEFRIPPILTSPDVLLRRVNPSDAVHVLDSRSVGTEWELLASVLGPLTAASGEVSNNAVVFRDTNGVVHELTTTPTVVYEGGPVPAETIIFWPEANGILVRVTEPLRSGVEYTAELKWELQIIT